MPDPSKPTLRATYTSPSTTTKSFANPLSIPIPSPDSPTAVKDKVAYLSELRTSAKQLQEDVNVFLTKKMEEDKATAGREGVVGSAPGDKKGVEKSRDEIEEENYGEEEVGDEDA